MFYTFIWNQCYFLQWRILIFMTRHTEMQPHGLQCCRALYGDSQVRSPLWDLSQAINLTFFPCQTHTHTHTQNQVTLQYAGQTTHTKLIPRKILHTLLNAQDRTFMCLQFSVVQEHTITEHLHSSLSLICSSATLIYQ